MSRRFRIAVTASAWLLLGASAPLAPYPVIDDARVQPLLVVADLRPAGELQNPEPRCNDDHPERSTMICLHDAYLLRANLRETVHGRAPGTQFDVAMTTHYGTEAYGADPGPYLALVLQDGDALVLATYANGRVFKDRTGDWVLPLPYLPRWLPCDARALAHPLAQAQFSARDWKDMGGDLDVRPEDRSRFLIVGKKAWPATGLSMRRLKDHLARTQPPVPRMFCVPAGD
jgi:hypothetical protein